MKTATREITWKSPLESVGEQKFVVAVREPESAEDLLTLCGSWDRIYDIVTQKLLQYANSSKAKFLEATEDAAALLVIEQVIAQGPKVDLTQTRGVGVATQVKELARLKAILEDPNSTAAQKIAALGEMGYNLN